MWGQYSSTSYIIYDLRDVLKNESGTLNLGQKAESPLLIYVFAVGMLLLMQFICARPRNYWLYYCFNHMNFHKLR